MKFSSPIAIAALLVAAQATALAGEVAVLRNGRSIRCERREQNGNIMRLYTSANDYVDVSVDSIASFEKDETPVAAAPAPSFQPVALPVPAPILATTSGPASAIQTPNLQVQPLQVDIQQLVREASERNRIDPDFVNSVIKAESGFYPRAVSRKGAQGLMQLMPGTAAQLGVTNPFDPKANVDAGTAYLSQLLDLYHDDPVKALAAYNAGAHRVDQYHGVPPYYETRAYVARIVRDFNAKKRAQMKAAASSSSPAAGAKHAKKQHSTQVSTTAPQATQPQ
ncbi:MAG TPA: lytic transglycosylase domain-containing protein [Verrucomicrobiae bacterium]|jgi:soluble lytic murein transglycosylase-like protein|nr:lytic transglycosylase domain-containing protein [Verrucomicrobiae bacterium]